ncbi:MAG: peptidylprolyl isomerase, partial [Pseudomonadales bacterium]|nr:peptidylprolyl isomerase [Pseudomonadales bacterium]
MSISKDSVVQFHYELKDEKGELIESSKEGEPSAYLHGHGNVIAGLEKAMEGKSAGESFVVTLEPAEAYGPLHEDTIQRIPIKHLQGAKQKKWKIGMTAWVKTEQGDRQVTVVKVGKFSADVDSNHPLAGRTLTFEVEVLEVRDA